MMSDRIVTCVYCGHEYPDGTPTSQDEKLTEHIKVCKKHPMRELEQQLAAANARVAELEKDNARQKRLATISRLCKNVQACRAEKAEAQLDKMRNCGNCDNWRDCWGEPEEVPGLESCDDHKCGGSTYVQDALIHRMKRMEDALREIAIVYADTSLSASLALLKIGKILEAALEEKP